MGLETRTLTNLETHISSLLLEYKTLDHDLSNINEYSLYLLQMNENNKHTEQDIYHKKNSDLVRHVLHYRVHGLK